MKKAKRFYLHLQNCWDSFQLRRIMSSMTGKSIFHDLKYLVRDLLRKPRIIGERPNLVWGSSGCGRSRYYPHMVSFKSADESPNFE